MTSPQKWTTGQDIAEQPGMAEMPLPSPADDAPTQQDDGTDAKSTDTKPLSTRLVPTRGTSARQGQVLHRAARQQKAGRM